MLFMVVGLLLPTGAVAIAAIQYMSAYQNLRNLGAYALLHPPSDMTTTEIAAFQTSMQNALTSMNNATCGDAASNCFMVMCGDPKTTASCLATPSGYPKYFVFTTKVAVSSAVSSIVPLGGPYTLTFTERFQ